VGAGTPTKDHQPHSRFAEELVEELSARTTMRQETLNRISERVYLLRDEADWLECLFHRFEQGADVPEPSPVDLEQQPLDDFPEGEVHGR